MILRTLLGFLILGFISVKAQDAKYPSNYSHIQKKEGEANTSTTDCPSWKKPSKKNARADYMNYISGSKKNKKSNQQQNNTTEYNESLTSSSPEKANTARSQSDFLNKKRYNITPAEGSDKQEKSEKQEKSFVLTDEKPSEKIFDKSTQSNVNSGSNTDEKLPEENIVSDPVEVKTSPEPTTKEIIADPVQVRNTREQKIDNPDKEYKVESDSDDGAVASAETKDDKKDKKQPSKLQKKLNKAFTKKNNKRAKPNYNKCTTKF